MARVAEVEFHPDAAAEFDAATDWYSEKNEQAAEDFVRAVDLATTRIAENPSMWAEYLYGARRYVLSRFPYLVVYIFHEGRVKIVAVAHGRRRPGYWKNRLNAQ